MSSFHLTLLITIITSFLNLFISSASSAPSSLQWQASILLSLKQGFETPKPSLNNWNKSNSIHFCSWTGVQCNENQSSIISLDLSNLNLSGSFSPIITNLQTLRNLSISGNDFSGIFPPQIHKLNNLQVLNVSNNQFNATLNWKFSHLSELVILDIYNNNFYGSLPPGVLHLKKLQYLDLGGNFFSGKIPPKYGSMEQLMYLSLAGNDLKGVIPPELGNLSRLYSLRLGYYNKFDGGMPHELGNLVNLVHLDISNCVLHGPIPYELGNLVNLEIIFLQTNHLSGKLPSSLGNLTKLKTLDLSNNELTGEIPYEFIGLRALVQMNLFINKFHGEIPRFVAEYTNLEVLKLWRNNFTGSIPPLLGQNGKLSELDLSTNKLTGLVPEHLCSGRKLKILILLDNFLFGPLPDDLGQCDSLVRVRLGQNYLNGSIPSGFLYLPELSLVELQNNILSGILKQETSPNKQNSKLSQLNLSNNRLKGRVPSSIGNLTSLQNLILSGNQFSGEIPMEIGSIKNLLKLDLSQNNLSGKIPPKLAECDQLTYLDLSQNQLSGPIPNQISQIHILNYLNLSYNHLSQSLPREIGSMKSLTSVDFSHNNFSGWIPENGQYSLFNYTSFADNPFLCGSFKKSCKNIPTPSSHSFNHHSIKFKLIILLGVLLLFSLVFLLLIMRKCRARKPNNSWKLTTFQKLDFKTQDILACIHDGNIIGKGGAGVVYKGTMPSGENIAVKKLIGITKDSTHDHGLGAEIKTVGKIRHRNIVRLLAYCSNKETNLLVFEYMPNGSLGEVLHGKRGAQLKWDTRLKIAIEAAKGLCYLHHDCSPLIVHRDVKSNNILLNMDFEAHVADFGLAKFLQNNGTSECMSAIAGSYGYIAPEYAYTLKVDEKSDVYSFGVVLLELLTGRKPVGDFGEEGFDIVQWTKMQTNFIKEKVVNIIDERLQDVNVDEAMQVFFVATLCVQEHSVERPTMREVVQMLTQAK